MFSTGMKASPVIQLLAGILALTIFPCLAEGQTLLQSGKANVTRSSQGFLHCSIVQYPRTFSSSANIRVLASTVHKDGATVSVHDSAVVWTAQVTQYNFRVCVLESGPGTNGSFVVNWVTFRTAPSGVLDGTASFSTFTSGTKCQRIDFVQHFHSVPYVLATVRYGGNTGPQDAMNMWLEEKHGDHFRICVREVKTFDGKHQNTQVDWVAFTQMPGELTFQGKILFENRGVPLEIDNFAFCKALNFTEEFYAPPVVMVTVNHFYDNRNLYSVKPENNALNTWIEEITISSFRICVKDLAGLNRHHDPVVVDYAVIGDLDPCINVSCNYFAVCKAFGPYDARCICVDNCPSYEEPVCSSNGTTYDNVCVFQREMCHLQANFSLYHPGDCTGFPNQKGRHRLRHYPVWAEAVCEQVPLAPYVFYPDKPVHIQVSVNHVNFSDPGYVHEAVVAWVEDILDNNFTVCVTQAGRNKRRNGETFATVDWLAYQGAPDGGVSGEMDMPTWWTGTSCRTASLPLGKFQSLPTVLVSAEHERRSLLHDASSVWLEDITTTSFKICVRELQNFDGAHQNVHIDWLAFEELHRPLFREHGSVSFTNGGGPSQEFNFAFCEDVLFKKPYNDSPEVLVSANHSTNGRNLNPLYNSISAWVEYVNQTGFRTCVKELFVQQYDPLSISYAVMPDVCEPGWTFFNGSCYFTSEQCETWTNANLICRAMGASLTAVESQEENVYIQHRHNGDRAWIGLNDIATEGLFTWVDGCPFRFRYWALNQPNDFRGEDCVHTLGVGHGYMWNDVDCSICHQYTCKKDFDECSSSPCLNGGTCVNGKRTFSCICPPTHKGKTCEEFDECSSSPCMNGGTCRDGANNFTCSCPSPYYGQRCQDFDDCHSNPCQNGGTCMDALHNFTCTCTSVYAGQLCEVLVGSSCKNLYRSGRRTSGIYYLSVSGTTFQVYCDMTSSGGGWTLISRFSNTDGANWMQYSGNWWYDRTSSYGSITSPSSNSDMISPAFWLVQGNDMRITRSDDVSTYVETYRNCIGGTSFRRFMASFGNFRRGAVWNSNSCRGRCYARYGGNIGSVSAFSQFHCGSYHIGGYSRVSFWCDWSSGDGSVVMVGGGGGNCKRADHGIGITEANSARFGTGNCDGDFGDDCGYASGYSLNLWIN
ncbi:uncharacterized protein LOC141874349 [Acropora palmata]|uniref:uncharacterized protein LOC141874349 n=1 Tax=Acropora palmata TaxID=6131 RepID=UPI003DA1BC33